MSRQFCILESDYLRPKKLPRMNETEMNQLLEEQILCRIAFCGKHAPYIALFQYALIEGQLYFHFTKYGKKIELLRDDKPVCVEIEHYTHDLSEYKFVTLTGKLRIVTDPAERALAIEKIVDTARKKRLSENFMVAHGFPNEQGWVFLTPDKPMVIVKLENVTEKIGLKS